MRGFLSENGEWLIKIEAARHYQYACTQERLGAEVLVGAAEAELARLQRLGLNVISHGLVAHSSSKIITITPHIDDLHKCKSPDFQQHTAPTLLKYYMNAVALLPELYLEDIDDNGQYSKLLPEGEPFLHDVEPYVADDRPLLDSKLDYLSALAMDNV